MSFPHTFYGSYGDEKVTSTSKIGGLPLGTVMMLPDGREYRHARNGGTALVAGSLYEEKAAEAATAFASGEVAVNSAALNAVAINITTTAGTALSANVYADGYLWTASSVGTGRGYLYKVKDHLATAGTAAATVVINLHDNDKVAVALQASTTTAGLRLNEYDSVVLTVASTVRTGTLCGVACATAAASAYVWLQSKGPAACLLDGTILNGQGVVASTAAAGAVATAAGTAAGSTISANDVIGYAMASAASLKFGPVDLRIR